MRVTPITPIYTQWDRKNKPKPKTKSRGKDMNKATTYKEIANELRKFIR